ncbi:MAG: chromate transporter, partial [Pseudomonadota bacterium]
VAIFVLQVPFPLIILGAAAIGAALLAARATAPTTSAEAATELVPLSTTLKTIATWLTIWIAPLVVIALAFGSDHVLTEAGIFFSKLAVVTFGGAYAVLAYMTQEVVQNFGWLTTGEMLDGLGLAETTPGPLILVTEFVGFLAGFKAGGWGLALATAIVTLWATFAPCFLWIFAGAPYVEWLNAQPRLKAALSAVTAAVVGVIANLAVWFGLNVLFGGTAPDDAGVAEQLAARADVKAIVLFAVAAVLLLVLRRGVLTTLGVAAALALTWHQLVTIG